MFTTVASRQQRKRFATPGVVYLLDSISASFNGVTTVFNLTISGAVYKPINAQSLFVSLNGVIQQPIVVYTVSGNQITFTTAPTSGQSCFIVCFATTIYGSTSVAGSNTQIQFNNSNVFGGDPNFTWNNVSGILTVGNSTVNTFVNSTCHSGINLINNYWAFM